MHVTAPLWSEYFKSYAKHFNLYENMVFGVCVKAIKKSQDGVKWLISLEGEEAPREFDKVIMATGTEVVAEHPKIEALERLEGKYMHGQAYKG
jgi:dimethylaniline monooxygenase (N-oxide forming)